MQDRLLACAKAHEPRLTLIVYHKEMVGLVNAYMMEPSHTRLYMMFCPRPVTREGLYVYLHECAHIKLHYGKRRPRHVEELEAERWAQEKMREAGIAVPREMLWQSKNFIRDAIETALRYGAKRIDPAAARYAGLPLKGLCYGNA